MSFDHLLSKQQLTALDNLRSQFLALPKSGLSLTQIQADCQDLPVVKLYKDIQFHPFRG